MLEMFKAPALGTNPPDMTFTSRGKRWTVKFVAAPFHYKGANDGWTLGVTDHSESRILVVNNAEAGQTLIHEILHAVWPDVKKGKKVTEEQMIRMLEEPLFEALATLKPVTP